MIVGREFQNYLTYRTTRQDCFLFLTTREIPFINKDGLGVFTLSAVFTAHGTKSVFKSATMANCKRLAQDTVVKLSAEAVHDFQDTISELLEELGIRIEAFVTGRPYGARCVIQWFLKDGELLNQTLLRVKTDSPFHNTYLHEALLSQRQMARRLRDVMRRSERVTAEAPASGTQNSDGIDAEEQNSQESLHLVMPNDF